jgi:hypothetical protein
VLRERIRCFQGLKIQLIQDDYRWVDEIAAAMRYMGVDVLFTLVPSREILRVWDERRLPGVEKRNTLAGYVPRSLVGTKSALLEERSIDIGYRGRVLPYWLGRLGQEKAWIAQGVQERAGQFGLRCDIDWKEEARIYGHAWNKFIGSCRAVLGTESGASITDFDGSIERRVKDYLVSHPNADFFEVHAKILEKYEGNVAMNVASPRIFEAAALRTALVLFPGEYSGVVEPWRHYIPLAKDFSNMDEVARLVRDDRFLRRMIERTYAELIGSGRYALQRFVDEVDEVIERRAAAGKQRGKLHYCLARLERAARPLDIIRYGIEHTAAMRIARTLVKCYVALRIALGLPELTKVLVCYATDARGAGLRTMAADLVRLGIVGQAERRCLTAGHPFRVVAGFDAGTGHLTIVSVRADQAAGQRREGCGPENRRAGDIAWEEVEGALGEGRVKSISWNHAALGLYVPYAVTRSKWVHFRLGQHGVYHFAAMSELVRRHPEPMARLLRQILRPRLTAWRWIRGFVREPGVTALRAFLVLRFGVLSRGSRRVLLAYLSDRNARRRVWLDRLLADLMRISLMRRPGVLGDSGLSVEAAYRAEEKTVAFSSVHERESATGLCPPPALTEAWRARDVQRIVWDHSAFESVARRRRFGVSLDPNGQYEFTALAAFAKIRPREAWLAIFGDSATIADVGQTCEDGTTVLSGRPADCGEHAEGGE